MRVLALVLAGQQVPDPAELRRIDAVVRHAATDPAPAEYVGEGAAGSGELARAALRHLVATRPDPVPVR